MAKMPWKLYVEEELVAAYDAASREFGRRTANEVAAEVLQTYLAFWRQTEEAKQVVLAEQQQQVGLEVSHPYAKGRGARSEMARVRKDAESREEKKRK